MVATTLIVLGSAIGLLYLYLSRKMDYWKRKGLIAPKPLPILGNYADLFLTKKNLGDTVTDICRQFPQEPIVGAYYATEPVVIIKDPELVKLITTKDFYYFNSRDLAGHQNREIVSQNVFFQGGDMWRVLRQNLTPIFTSAKMKKMFHLIQDRTQDFKEFLAMEIGSKKEHDARAFMAKYTMDCIGSCIFGLETKVMTEKHNSPFVEITDKIFQFTPFKTTQINVRSVWPSISYLLGFEILSKEINQFFAKLLVGVFRDRNYTAGPRNDFVDYILGFKAKNYIEGDDVKSLKPGSETKRRIKLDVNDETLVAQCIVFFVAGFDTSAATMATALFELSKKPEIQQKVLEEVDEFLLKTGGKITYDCVTDLPYLDACLDETLRLYPVLGVITREVVEDYKLPSGLLLEKGTRVHLPVQYIQRDPEHFPEPDEFRPERFLGDNKKDINPYTYFPFGEGPRICIGLRFAKMQMLAGLVAFFRDYCVELPAHMPKIIEFAPKPFTAIPKDKINLNFIPRQKPATVNHAQVAL